MIDSRASPLELRVNSPDSTPEISPELRRRIELITSVNKMSFAIAVLISVFGTIFWRWYAIPIAMGISLLTAVILGRVFIRPMWKAENEVRESSTARSE